MSSTDSMTNSSHYLAYGPKAQIQCIYFKPKGPKKVEQGPKFGPGAHGMDNPGIQY